MPKWNWPSRPDIKCSSFYPKTYRTWTGIVCKTNKQPTPNQKSCWVRGQLRINPGRKTRKNNPQSTNTIQYATVTQEHDHMTRSSESYKQASALVGLGLIDLSFVCHRPEQLSTQAHMLPRRPVLLCWASHGDEQMEHPQATPSLLSWQHKDCPWHSNAALHIPLNCNTVSWVPCCLQSLELSPWGHVELRGATASKAQAAFLETLVSSASSPPSIELWPQGADKLLLL